jgi:hypothetical protein
MAKMDNKKVKQNIEKLKGEIAIMQRENDFMSALIDFTRKKNFN